MPLHWSAKICICMLSPLQEQKRHPDALISRHIKRIRCLYLEIKVSITRAHTQMHLSVILGTKHCMDVMSDSWS